MANNTSGSCSNCIGSIAYGSAGICLTAGYFVDTSLITATAASLAFTSTDWLGICITGKGITDVTDAQAPKIIIRYKDA